MESAIKLKIAKYTAKSAARKALLERRHQHITSKLVRAHKRLARVHELAYVVADPREIDLVYDREFSSNHANVPPSDADYSTLIEQVTLSPLPDDKVYESLSKIRHITRKTMSTWQQLETDLFKLAQVTERTDKLYALIRTKKSAAWVYSHLYF